ncbi:MAG: UDP-N-acetylmuramoyl-L-alanyl-D-glutamate--2,6-diaminopimelate ligase [Clostridiales Family XIII bacterium]|jgi:UDP-N-acetylmuramoyl-L-alanyl-D-glutamate--2,6-diaminopimelate ligase|nr:UDP-N-acetylmuramoyl-L-alanyl-D-glutamate--2,6-diaminopimelate ligase [Clostridiales Family XIII bacterium]
MKIETLFDGIDYKLLSGDPDTEITGINIDSRLVKKGDLFVATVGRNSDGHDYIDKAAEQGAAAVLVQSDYSYKEYLNATIIATSDTREVLSKLVNNFRGEPSKRFNLIGITGTNGKTSTAAMIDHILSTEGHKTGLLGTIDNYCGGEVIETLRTTPTTPDCIELGEIMTLMADNKVDDLIMEVSSMGLKAGRVTACDIDIGVFTNLSPEHLDDHGTMEDYKASKLRLFDIAKKAVINADDPVAEEAIAKAKGEVLTYGLEQYSRIPRNIHEKHPPNSVNSARNTRTDAQACLIASDVEYTGSGVSFTAAYTDPEGKAHVNTVSTVTPSEFAIYNALAAMGAAILSGIAPGAAAKALSDMGGVAGRYEVITSENGISAIIDYAHTAKALENLLEAVRAVPAYKRIISVFGCGGDRDPSKRAPMGEISGRLADYSVITSDNPRTEDPVYIVKQVEEGIKKTGRTRPAYYEAEPDRRAAIELAVSIAEPGDAIVIAGKGHEDYQILGTGKIHFDDREEIRRAFAALAAPE